MNHPLVLCLCFLIPFPLFGLYNRFYNTGLLLNRFEQCYMSICLHSDFKWHPTCVFLWSVMLLLTLIEHSWCSVWFYFSAVLQISFSLIKIVYSLFSSHKTYYGSVHFNDHPSIMKDFILLKCCDICVSIICKEIKCFVRILLHADTTLTKISMPSPHLPALPGRI